MVSSAWASPKTKQPLRRAELADGSAEPEQRERAEERAQNQGIVKNQGIVGVELDVDRRHLRRLTAAASEHGGAGGEEQEREDVEEERGEKSFAG